MNREDRAKQFLPFDAMKGLTEALRAKDEIHSRVEKRELSEDMAEELSATLNKVAKGARIRITFFYKGHYLDIEGNVEEISGAYKYLVIGKERIYFDDIYDLDIISA